MASQQNLRRFGAVVAVAALALAGCTATEPEPTELEGIPSGIEPQPLEERTTITINTAARIESFSALFLAEEMGEFDAENLDVQFTQVSSADALPGLGQNQIQVMGSSPNASLFNAISQGVDVKMTIPCYSGSTDRWWVRNEILEEGPEALEGSIVASAVGPGGSSILGLDGYLSQGGLDVTDVTVQQFPAADVPTALIQGAVDAAYVPEPGARAVEASGLASPVDTMPVDGGNAQCVYIFGPQLLIEQPEVGAAVARAIARTMRDYLTGDYKSDPEIVEALASALERTPEEISATPSLEFDPSLSFSNDLYLRMQEIWISVGDIVSYDAPIDSDDLIDPRFAEAVSN